MGFWCVICGSNQATVEVAVPDYQLMQCGRCTTLQLWPQPAAETLQRFYNRSYYTRHLETWFSRLFMRFFHRWEVRRVQFLRALQPTGRFLDVGCGAGELLADMAAQGYEVCGTEVSQMAFQAIPPVLHARVKVGELEDCNFPENFFHLVMLSDVLEHTYDPLKTLKEVARVLRSDGWLVVSVPNWDDPDAHVFPRKCWHNMDVPLHLWQFTAATLPRLAERAGLTVTGAMRLGWVELFEAPLSLVHAWERYLLAAGVGPHLARGLKWLGSPFLLLLTFLVRITSATPRQLRLVFKKA